VAQNDYNNALAIAEASQHSSMRCVPITTIEQQDMQNLHRQRERIKISSTALVNQVRGLLSEYGLVIPQRVEGSGCASRATKESG
jgi:transposase